jgi:hypothetical protein
LAQVAPIRARVAAVDGGAGGFLEHLLVAALQRTIALAQMHGAALAVAEDLHLDMARPPEVFLDIDLVIAKGGLGLAPRGAEGGFQLRLGSAPASCRARRRLPWP